MTSEALAAARCNTMLNAFDEAHAEWQGADVFKTLRTLCDEGRSFDLIVFDPLKFAGSPQHVERAAGIDHPMTTSFHEGEYLKGLLLHKAV